MSLEMACTEVEHDHAELKKQFDGLKLEVGCMSRLLEQESFMNPQIKPRIFCVG
jgi:hypothetical protein